MLCSLLLHVQIFSLPLRYRCKRYIAFNFSNMTEFEITEEYIDLIKLLKATQVAESGAMAKILVENKEVLRNGEVETRKRAKIRKGETIEAIGQTIHTV